MRWLRVSGIISGLLDGDIFASTVLAAGQGSGITTSPVSADLTAKPGSGVTTTLQVENNSPQPVAMTIELDTFRAYGTNGQAQIFTTRPGDASLSWVHFSKTSFIAQSGVWTPVQMTIDLPKDAGLGYYYAVLFKPKAQAKSPAHTNVVKGYNAILVLLDADNGNAHPRVDVTSFAADHKLYEYLPANFSVSVRNSGNIFLPPTGNIFISKSSNFNHVIDTLAINPGHGDVLPGSSRVFNGQWNDGFPIFTPETLAGQPVTDKNGKAIDQLKWNFSNANKLRFGKYYAKLSARLPQRQP